MKTLRLSEARLRRLEHLLRDIEEQDHALMPVRERIATWLRRFEASTPFKPSYTGASAVHVPMIAIAQNAIKARIMSSIFDQDQCYNAEPFIDAPVIDPNGNPLLNESGKPVGWRDISEDIQEYISFEISSSGQVRFRDFVEDIIEGKTIEGTAFPTVAWEKEVAFKLDPNGETIPYVRKDQIRLAVPEFDRLIIPKGYPDLSRVPYITEKYHIRPSEVIARVRIGWDEVKVKQFLKEHAQPQQISFIDQQRDSIEGDDSTTIYKANELWMGETWCMFDWSGDGKEVPLLVDHSIGLNKNYIFRTQAWPYAHGKSKFVTPDRYIKRKNRMLGMGLCERGEHLDEAISAIINQIIDQGTRANTSMWGVDEDVVGIEELASQSPGAVVPRGDDPNAITEIRSSGTQPDLFENFNILMMLFEKLIGVSDYDLGRESQQIGKDSTATGTLALLKQSHLNMSSVVSATHQTLNEVGWMWLQLIAQQKPVERMVQVLGPHRARNVLIALSLKPSELTQRIGLIIAYSKDAATQELQRQQEMAKWGMYEQFLRGMMELAMTYLQNPYLAGYVLSIAKDAHTRMRKLLESYGESYSSKALPDLATFLKDIQPGALMVASMEEEGGTNEEA